MDWWIKAALLHTKAITARNKGDEAGYQEHKIKKHQISFTIFKFISLYLYSFISQYTIWQ
jgi:hypothetical protein